MLEWITHYVLQELIKGAGLAVAIAWSMQLLAGKWNASPDWPDRLGRFLGLLWIVAGLLWATRPYLRLM
jgi:hypothetical protein